MNIFCIFSSIHSVGVINKCMTSLGVDSSIIKHSLPPTACRSILKPLELCTGFMWCIRCMGECSTIKGT